LVAACSAPASRPAEPIHGGPVAGSNPVVTYSALVASAFERLAQLACGCTDDQCRMLAMSRQNELQTKLDEEGIRFEPASCASRFPTK
jgi:hypothetical protein